MTLSPKNAGKSAKSKSSRLAGQTKLIRLVSQQGRQIESLRKEVDFLKRRLEKVKISDKMLTLRDMDKEEARRMITEYVRKNPGTMTSEIIENLQLNPALVIDVLDELRREEQVSNTP